MIGDRLKPSIVFDVMSTLVVDPFYEAMPAFFGMSFSELLAQKDPNSWIDFEVNKMTEREFLDGFFKDRRRFDHEAFREAVFSAYRWIDGVEAVLDQLIRSGYSMAILSNYPCWFQEIQRRLDIDANFDVVLVSYETGTRKPAIESYRNAIEKLGCVASSCVFVDDSVRTTRAALQLGMDAVLFSNTANLEGSLKRRGLI
ncbi:MAG: HAD-IA family hydrolase [Polyangiales bacterium]